MTDFWDGTLAHAIYKKFKEEQQKKYGNQPVCVLVEDDDKPRAPSVIWSIEKVDYEYYNTLRQPYKYVHQNEWALLSMEILNQMTVLKTAPHDIDLHIAVKQGFPSIINRILQFNNINVNSIGFNGRTPLHECICQFNMNLKIFCILIDAGADFSIPDNHGETCLNLIILFWNRKGQEWLPLLLMDRLTNYDYTKVNNKGENLLQYAKSMNAQPSVIQKIESLMG